MVVKRHERHEKVRLLKVGRLRLYVGRSLFKKRSSSSVRDFESLSATLPYFSEKEHLRSRRKRLHDRLFCFPSVCDSKKSEKDWVHALAPKLSLAQNPPGALAAETRFRAFRSNGGATHARATGGESRSNSSERSRTRTHAMSITLEHRCVSSGVLSRPPARLVGSGSDGPRSFQGGVSRIDLAARTDASSSRRARTPRLATPASPRASAR